jgi:hypothetical protein
MVGSDILRFFEDYYYSKLPAGRARRIFELLRRVWIAVEFEISRRIKLRWRIWFGQRPSRSPPVLVKMVIGS